MNLALLFVPEAAHDINVLHSEIRYHHVLPQHFH